MYKIKRSYPDVSSDFYLHIRTNVTNEHIYKCTQLAPNRSFDGYKIYKKLSIIYKVKERGKLK